MQFTAEEAFDARDVGEPIMMTRGAAQKLINEHGADFDVFCFEVYGGHGHSAYDAANVLNWLGY